MQVTRTKIRLGTRNRPEQTRAAILDAALHEFAQEGVSGARIDAIARSARVNKALLYYYFKDKESLYGAVIERVFGQLSERISEALARELPIREKYLAYVARISTTLPAIPCCREFSCASGCGRAAAHRRIYAELWSNTFARRFRRFPG